MQHTLFIADLHLDEKHITTTQYFLNFLKNQTKNADALYILGDFFEMWVGDDDNSAYLNQIKQQLSQLSIPIYFIHGNRDFLIGHKFSQQIGCTLLPDGHKIDIYGEQVVILHGDALCTDDIAHMKFRKFSQSLIVKKSFLVLPLSLRKKIGRHLRKNSSKNHLSSFQPSDDVNHNAVCALLNRHHVTQMIHGHTHRPKQDRFMLNHQPAERIVLGSWDKQGCVLKWYINGKREMVFFS